MKGNFHVRFLGGKAPVRELTYPARREHQPSAEGGQRGVRLQRLSLPCRDLRHTENHPAEQRHRAQPRDHLPPAERIAVG